MRSHRTAQRSWLAVAAVVAVAAIMVGATALLLSDRTVRAHDEPQDQDIGVLSYIPKVARIWAVAPEGETKPYKAGEFITFRVEFSHTIITDGESRFVIKVGDNYRYATRQDLDGGTAFLTYRYQVQDEDLDTDGVSVPRPPVDPETQQIDEAALPRNEDGQPMMLGVIEFVGCGSIRGETDLPAEYAQAAGLDAIRTLPELPDDPGHTVDGVPPTVSGVTVQDAPDGGSYGAGDDVAITATFSEPVSVTGGNPSLTIRLGDQPRTAAFQSQSQDKRIMTFAYRVQKDDAAPDGVSVDADSIILPEGASITDAVGNAAVLTHQAVAANPKAAVDAVAPTISSIAMVGDAKTYETGDTLKVRVTFSEAINLTGTPKLVLTVGTAAKAMKFHAHNGATIDFTYKVQEGDVDSDGVSVAAGTLVGATATDANSNLADLTHQGMADQVGYPVSAAPAAPGDITALSLVGDRQFFRAGQSIVVKVEFDERVRVRKGTTAGPELDIAIGTTTRVAEFTRKEPTALYFTYLVKSGDNDANGVSIPAGQLRVPANASIINQDGEKASLSHGGLTDQSNFVVDTTSPFVASFSVAGEPATYDEGGHVVILAKFNEPVAVNAGGKPSIVIKVGDGYRRVNFERNQEDGGKVVYRDTLRFVYVVRDGDLDEDGISMPAVNMGQSTGTWLRDRAGNDALRSHSGMSDQAGYTVDTRH